MPIRQNDKGQKGKDITTNIDPKKFWDEWHLSVKYSGKIMRGQSGCIRANSYESKDPDEIDKRNNSYVKLLFLISHLFVLYQYLCNRRGKYLTIRRGGSPGPRPKLC